jgi:hypothetical protein
MVLIGFPRPSTARRILLLSPPGSAQSLLRRLRRPRPQADSPLFPGPGGMLVCPDDGRIDTDDPLDLADPVVLHDRLGKDLRPCAIQRPPPQPLVRSLPRPVPLRHVPPGRTGAQFEQDRVDHLPVIPPLPPRPDGGRNGSILAHALSVNSPLPTTQED